MTAATTPPPPPSALPRSSSSSSSATPPAGSVRRLAGARGPDVPAGGRARGRRRLDRRLVGDLSRRRSASAASSSRDREGRLGFARRGALGAAPWPPRPTSSCCCTTTPRSTPMRSPRLVEATQSARASSASASSGAKVVDWERPARAPRRRPLRGPVRAPYTPLQPGEIDQGQFDRVLDVLSCRRRSMLVARDAWKRVGLFDERLDAEHERLDFCWRARVAGFRVLMTPLARDPAPGGDGGGRAAVPNAIDEPPLRGGPSGDRLDAEELRAAVAAVGRAARARSWASSACSTSRCRGASRRPSTSSRPGAGTSRTCPGRSRRRRRVQKARRSKDRPAPPVHGIGRPAAAAMVPDRRTDPRGAARDRGGGRGQARSQRRLRDRTASLVGTHPVLVASFLGHRRRGGRRPGLLIGPDAARRRRAPGVPVRPGGFIAELVSGVPDHRSGGVAGGEPRARSARRALVALVRQHRARAEGRARGRAGPGGDPAVPGGGAPHRHARRIGGRRRGLRAVRRSCCGPSRRATGSAGRARRPPRRRRATRGRLRSATIRPTGGGGSSPASGVTLAVGVAFLPGAALALALVRRSSSSIAGAARGRGLGAHGGSAVVAAAVLLFPFVPTIDRRRRGGPVVRRSARRTCGSLLRLAPGGGPGTWVVAAFLPIAAVLGVRARRRRASRARAIRAASWRPSRDSALSWLAAAGYLPAPLSNPLAYLGRCRGRRVGAGGRRPRRRCSPASDGSRSGCGRSGGAAGRRARRRASLLQVVAGDDREAGRSAGLEQIPAAWAVVESGARGDFRVLWLGADDGTPFPAPGGDAAGHGRRGRRHPAYRPHRSRGTSARSTSGARSVGPGRERAREALDELLSGTTDARRRAARPVRRPVRRRRHRLPARGGRRAARSHRSISTSCPRPGW